MPAPVPDPVLDPAPQADPMERPQSAMTAFYSRPPGPWLAFTQRGFTLIESVITIVVLGIGISAIVGLMSVQAGRSATPLLDTRLRQVGRAYLEEILAHRFAETLLPVPSCQIVREEGSRAAFDDVDDYHGIDESPPRTQISSWMSQFSTVRVRVRVVCAGAEIGLPQGAAKRITVTVTDASGATQTYSAYRSLYEER